MREIRRSWYYEIDVKNILMAIEKKKTFQNIACKSCNDMRPVE